jgi:hypothetical protein
MRRLKLGIATALVALLLSSVASQALAGTGSNQGSYAINFSPAVVTGQITNSGSPVAGATITTVAGHTATANGSGVYTLQLDAPGIYTVTAKSGGDSATDTVTAVFGTSATLNMALSGAAAPTPTPTPVPVPGISSFGLIALAALLLAAMVLTAWRRQRGAAAGLFVIAVVAMLPWGSATALLDTAASLIWSGRPSRQMLPVALP